MYWTYQITLLLLLFCPKYIQGVSWHISGSSPYAVLNKTFTFTCTVTDAEDLVDVIAFYKTTSTYGSRYQTGNTCIPFYDPMRGYNISCGSGTNSSSSTTKIYNFVIYQVATHDVGDWSCRLFRSLRMSTFSLIISNGPGNITFNPSPPAKVIVGGNVNVNCTADCIPPCSYSWTLENKPVGSTSLLALKNIGKKEAGGYMCTANNTILLKSVIKTFKLTVVGVSWDISGSSPYAVLNKTFTFTCTVTDAEDLVDVIAFYKRTSTYGSRYQTGNTCIPFYDPMRGYNISCGSGTNSSSSTTKIYTFVIYQVAPHDVGDWSCRLFRSLRMSTFSLIISNGPGNITFNPSPPTKVIERANVTVNCTADCVPPCSYSWTLENKPVGSTSLLALKNIGKKEAGGYMCTANNTIILKSVIKTFKLTVGDGPGNITFNPSPPAKVIEGANVTVNCTADCVPPCSYSWTLENKPVGSTLLLALKNIGKKEAGVYMCTANNTFTLKSVIKTFKLTVVDGPGNITFNPSPPAKVIEGANVTVNCTADCVPPCSYSWTLENKPVGSTSLLALKNIGKKEAGVYMCTANNTFTLKSVIKTFKLTVVDGPGNITFNPSPPAKVIEGANVTVNCTADCVPPCSYSWTLENKPVGSTSLLALKNIGKKEAGVYMCTATNTFTLKSVIKTFKLTVVEEPLFFLSGSSSYAVFNESFTFTCTVTQAAGLYYLVDFYINDALESTWASLEQKISSCDIRKSAPPGYTASCGSGTDRSSSTTKNYTLRINRVAVSDDVIWSCKLSKAGIRSHHFSLPVYTPVYNVSIEIFGSMTGAVIITEGRSINITEGISAIFTCVIQGAKPAPKVAWYRELSLTDAESMTGKLGNQTTFDRTTSINVTYTANRQHQGQKVYCTAINSLMVNRGIHALSSSNKILLNIEYATEHTSALTLRTFALSGIGIAVVLAVAIPAVWILCRRKTENKPQEAQNMLTTLNQNQADNPVFFRN
ncbi:hemicentin-2-like isoform X2 [Gigantopelta aegis]|uniref:hemicentin-2-like isoform X2 n=1 Tax=Gigantopelta aegis TaxID=1735272 RepID=UPI001B88AFD1|nr:hemicentin-2-like isoform X2 [Gigantopelta aegis]